MQLPPIEVLLTWPKPNYDNPPTRGHAVLVVTIICLSLSTIITLLRVWTRLRITRTAGLDDVLIVFGLVFGIGMGVVLCIATEQYGWDRHIWDIPLELLPAVSKLNLSFQILFSLSCSITKLSLLWFCKRLLIVGTKGVYSRYNIAMIVAMVVVALSCILFLFFSLFHCRPIHAYWDLEPQYPHHCLNDGAIVFSASTINIITDVVVTILPMPLIWKLKLPVRQRLAVISIFGLGIIVDVAGSIRTAYVYKSMLASYDTTWEGWPVLLAATIEINVGLICTSAPALRPLVNLYLPRLVGSSHRYGSSRSQDRNRISWKLRSSTTASKQSRSSHHYGAKEGMPSIKVLRTVEMETYSETRSAHQTIGSVYDISSQPLSPAQTEEIHLTHGSVSERSMSPPSSSIHNDVKGLPPGHGTESV
ncbi:hypothetical protein BJY04DRAFT_216616 [Aspergillus karnatakaensis]|uniref:uncharacterized protein n=1 Tax=Aspergillus karnatakaensis TaxID=1810916 RepID=UPI003CCDC31D